MVKSERIKMVRSMEFVIRQLNDEELLEGWLMSGVADGDIDGTESDEDLEYYVDDDEVFAGLMNLFLEIMAQAHIDKSGLYCDGVVSK